MVTLSDKNFMSAIRAGWQDGNGFYLGGGRGCFRMRRSDCWITSLSFTLSVPLMSDVIRQRGWIEFGPWYFLSLLYLIIF